MGGGKPAASRQTRDTLAEGMIQAKVLILACRLARLAVSRQTAGQVRTMVLVLLEKRELAPPRSYDRRGARPAGFLVMI